MTPFEERFHQMKADLEDLKIDQDEKDQIMIKKREMRNLAREFDSSPKNTELKNKTQKEYIDACINYLRSSNDIVRKISGPIANKFEDEINKFEKEFSLWSDPTDDLIKKFYKSSEKLNAAISKPENYSVDKMNDISKEARKNIEKIREKNKAAEQIGKNLTILASKIQNMTDGFDSLIEFIDGNRIDITQL